MINNFSIAIGKGALSVAPFLYQNNDNPVHCVSTADNRAIVKYSGWNLDSSNDYILVNEDGFCLIHGKAYINEDRTLPITSESFFKIFLKEGSFVFRRMSGNFAIMLEYNNNLYVVAPKTSGASVYYFRDEAGIIYLTNDIRSLPSNKLKSNTGYLNEGGQFYEPGNTRFAEVKLLTAGHYLHLSFNTELVKQVLLIPYWWPSSVSHSIDFQELCFILQKSLSNAVEKIECKDVVSFISGGVDSSVVTYLAAKKNIKIQTFSIGTEEFNEFDEAEILAKYINSKHENITVTESDLLTVYAEVVGAVGHAYSIYIEYLVPGYLAMRQAVKPGETVISGYGSDVLFAGFAKNGNSIPQISDLIDTEYTTTLWSNEATYNLINVKGVDVVYPFFDQEVVDIALSIPPSMKYKDGWEKWILRKAVENWLPPEIVWRRKIGIHQTTGMEAYLSKYLSRYCPSCIDRIGMRKTKDQFTLHILEALVIERHKPTDIDFSSICNKLT